MGQVGALGPYLPTKSDGISDELVRVVCVFPIVMRSRQVSPHLEIVQLCVVYRLHIRDVSQLTEAVTEDGELTMHYSNRCYLDVTNDELRMRLDTMKVQFRYSWI